MKLLLTKAQSKGLLGGVKFEVKAKVELTDEESKLVRHYNLNGEMLLSKKFVDIFGHAHDDEMKVTVDDLILGETYKCKALNGSDIVIATNNYTSLWIIICFCTTIC